MSVFTYDVDPPRVASPWLQPAEPGKKEGGTSNSLSDYGVTKLDAEPQDGPTEYKLHLLLRPRRPYQYMSTAKRVSGSIQTRQPSECKSSKLPPPPGPGAQGISLQTRQDRLMHLTTQLLWRLQQSSAYNPGRAASDLVVPQLPDDALTSQEPPPLARLPPGLESSRGALYEIGVADDGTLVGLTKDEMSESLRTLRVMASSLGCTMEVLRQVIVGECEWKETHCGEDEPGRPEELICQGKLWVAEALVSPELARPEDANRECVPRFGPVPKPDQALLDVKLKPLTRHQLRVTLTGPTTGGKSTLLGTLSTGIVDNGRGKSRQNLLKHRHELVSGITSSVTQEIIGYNGSDIINYAHPGIESWIDIHDYTNDGRLVYIVDSAGHHRYRRTILRGTVGWAPHWTLLCLAADDTALTPGHEAAASAQEPMSAFGAGLDFAKIHLDLCLQLEVPLAIVITKYDLASKISLHRLLHQVLTSVKKIGRVPRILSHASTNVHVGSQVSDSDLKTVNALLDSSIGDNLLGIIPIVLTSAVNGSGLGLLHALLRNLPLPRSPTSRDYIGDALNPEQPASLFHIEDRYSLPASSALATTASAEPTDFGTVVAGYLRFGSLSVGDKVVVGPFPSAEDDAAGNSTPEDRQEFGSCGLSISHSSSAELSKIAQKNTISASAIKGEWHQARIVSIRNMRLPVQTLESGQVGSIGIIFDMTSESNATESTTAPRLRKGMVLAIPSEHMLDTGLSLQAASGLTACIQNPHAAGLAVGSLVNIYVASVRAAARITRVSRASSPDDTGRIATHGIDDVFTLSEEMEEGNARAGTTVPEGVEVQLDLLASREWIELGSKILILEGSARGKSGLEGYVGKIVEIMD